MKKKITSKVTATPELESVVASSSDKCECPKVSIAKLESFGNEDMHRLVAKINEIIDVL